ncbi:UDP-glucose:glycoprotein glucosyltransferase [Acorus calamus]|uniref:UDP-glucose:glycoprotein glucosyltransferase n=1 Tax=Acorus calamus TaxID=4465 RepID=A0AAV9E9H9_ACOCL|nr:UDP-glucose:glycoprotein glucosyltransferase [Acorus calamus]
MKKMGFCSRSRFPLFAFVLFLVVLCALGTSASAESNRRPKNVQVSLRSKWSGTPLLLEAGVLPVRPHISVSLESGHMRISYAARFLRPLNTGLMHLK